MASLEMDGPFDLNSESIDEQITCTSPGNYALGYFEKSTFSIQYVGRADEDVKRRLKEHLEEKYKHFMYSYATSPKDAFEKECKNFHDFGGMEKKLDNKIHPDRPNGRSWKCPVCDVFDE